LALCPTSRRRGAQTRIGRRSEGLMPRPNVSRLRVLPLSGGALPATSQ
jgi:hypothetical protein